MIIKTRPKIGWFIHFLAILLICILIANSVLGAIYIKNLKNKLSDITDNYFLAEGKLQNALEALAQTRVETLKYEISLMNSQNTEIPLESPTQNRIFLDFRKNALNLSSLLLSLQKQEINGYMKKPISQLNHLSSQYLLNLEKILSSPVPPNSNSWKEDIEKSNIHYLKIKQNLPNLKLFSIVQHNSLID